jgi:uncharacterized membrane protein YccC
MRNVYLVFWISRMVYLLTCYPDLITDLEAMPAEGQKGDTVGQSSERLAYAAAIGHRLKQLRKARHWTQRTLAKRARFNDWREIQQIESGQHAHYLYTVQRLLDAMGYTLADLDGSKVPRRRKPPQLPCTLSLAAQTMSSLSCGECLGCVVCGCQT